MTVGVISIIREAREDTEGDHGHDDEEEGEEVDIGFLEVGPR